MRNPIQLPCSLRSRIVVLNHRNVINGYFEMCSAFRVSVPAYGTGIFVLSQPIFKKGMYVRWFFMSDSKSLLADTRKSP